MNSTEATRWEITCFLIWVIMVVASFFSALRPSAPIAAIAMLAVALLSAKDHWFAQGLAGFLRPVAVGTICFVAVAFILDSFVRPSAYVPEAVESFVITCGILLQPLADLELRNWFILLTVLLVIGVTLKKWQFTTGTISFLKFLGSIYAALIAFASFSFFAAPPTTEWAEGMTREVVSYAHDVRLCFDRWEERAKKAELLGKALERQRDELKEFKSDVDWIAALNSQSRGTAADQWIESIFGPKAPDGPEEPPPPLPRVRPSFLDPSIFEPTGRRSGREPIPRVTEFRNARAASSVTVNKLHAVRAQTTAKVQLLSNSLSSVVAELPAGSMLGKQLVTSIVEEALTKVRLDEFISSGETRVKEVIRNARQRAVALRQDFRAAFTVRKTPLSPQIRPSPQGTIPPTAHDVIIKNKITQGAPLTAADRERIKARCPICGKANCPLAQW